MHVRHRSPGNGYRSSSIGMGLPASRISPEGSVRGHGFYNSEYRNFNRGFGRGQGQPKPFQSPQQTSRKSGDIFMEAGRLAAEYLVTQGMLSPDVLSGKWQNGSLKKQVGDFLDVRSQEGDNLHLQPEGRTSALARLGNSPSDAGPGRRRYPDDHNSMGSRNHLKGRRRGESFRSYSLDWGREYGRSGSMDRARVSPDFEGDDDPVSGHQEEQQGGKDDGNGLQKSNSSELAPKGVEAGDSESELDKYRFADETGSKTSSSSSGKDPLHKTDGELSKRLDDIAKLNLGTKELKDGSNNDETEKPKVTGDSPIQCSGEDGGPLGKNSPDLLTLCKFAKVPTRTRSSLTYRGSKVDSIVDREENTSGIGTQRGSEVMIEDESLHDSSGDMLSNKSHDSKCPESEISKVLSVQSVEDVVELNPAYAVEQGNCMRSHSFPDRAFIHDNNQESGLGLPGLERSSSVMKARGEKRVPEESDLREGTKKPRDWLPSMVTKADEYFHLSNLSEKKLSSQEESNSPCQKVTVAVDQESLVNNSIFARAGGDLCVESQEKQLFPSSFKICDLNLMEASDMNENHHSDPILIYPSISETKKEAAQVDIDLSISNSNLSGEYSRRMNDGKEIEVIDLENDSVQEDKAMDNSERKTETVFTGLEGFSNHAQNAADIPDVQDHYDGLMISEFLNSFPNCTSVAEDINPLQNEIGLHNAEGTLADDDSIYMSLGEIPLSFLRAWEQPPPQEYEKPF